MKRITQGTKKIAADVTEAVGSVPTVRLNQLDPICKERKLYLKLEACNPGGSIKEKNAVYLVREAESMGLLKPGGTIVESSSGNFGIGLAMVGASKGYKVKIVVDAKTPKPTRRILSAYGAELVDVPLSKADANGSMQVARMARAKEISETEPNTWYPCQHLNPSNPLAHSVCTAEEILHTFDGVPPDVIVIGISTSGQLTGIGDRLRQQFPKTRLVGVDVAGSVILGTPPSPYKMTGLGLSFVPPQFRMNLLDSAYSINDTLAFSACRLLATQEGLLLGASTGAIVFAGLAYAKHFLAKHESMLMINPDRGDRYLETVYNDEWITEQKIELLSLKELQIATTRQAPVDSFNPSFIEKKSA